MTARSVLVSGLTLLAITGSQVAPGEAGGETKLSLSPPTEAIALDTPFIIDLEATALPSPGLQNWIIDVIYDPTRLSVDSCEPQPGCFVSNPNVRLQGFEAGGITGDHHFGSITFRGIAIGDTPLEIDIFGMSDTNADPLAAGTNDSLVSVLPGLDDTPTPTTTPTASATPDPNATPTGTATGSPTPGPTATPATGTIVVDVTKNTGGGVDGFEVNLFEGDGCLGSPIAGGFVERDDIDETTEWHSPSVPAPASYSVSLKPLAGWQLFSAPCQDVFLGLRNPPVANFAFASFAVAVVRNGDANRDGRTDSRDALAVLHWISGFGGIFTLNGLIRGDVNQDDVLDARDAQLILQLEAGLIDSLPVGG